MGLIVERLCKTYGSQKAVDDISFEARKGEIVGFLGPNGAGKSTTMKIATCYVPPTSGEVSVCGFSVNSRPLQARQNIGYLPEHNPLYLDMYVREYLAFIGGLHDIPRKKLKNRIEEMVELTGLTKESGKKISTLSKGYRQRVGLAQALIHNPQVLILDEPTTGLDPNQLLEIRAVIKNIGADKTVIFSTHIMQEVQAICSRAIIIDQGKIVADGPVESLKNDEGFVWVVAEFEALPESWAALHTGEEIVSIETSDGNSLRIKTRDGLLARKRIFKTASENAWPLIGLYKEEASLENAFIGLTGRNKTSTDKH